MQKYIKYKNLLLDQFEWAGGYGAGHKFVMKEQASRRREVKKGHAKIVEGD